MRGCSILFDGELEIPSPKASTRMTKYFEESASLPGPTHYASSFVVPPAQVGNSTAFDLAVFSSPAVRYPSFRFIISCPFSSRKLPNEANFCSRFCSAKRAAQDAQRANMTIGDVVFTIHLSAASELARPRPNRHHVTDDEAAKEANYNGPRKWPTGAIRGWVQWLTTHMQID